jgi:hypothetical protein
MKMRKSDAKLERLFTIARHAPATREAPLPSHWQTRVLARWDRAALQGEFWVSLHRNLRRGFVCAAVFMFVCIVWSMNAPVAETEADFDLASFELRMDGLQ